MKKAIFATLLGILGVLAIISPVQAASGVSLQVHNPTGGSGVEPAGTKSQFVMKNDSTAGINIQSILWQFATPLFIDSTAAAPGFGGFRDYTVSPADTYGSIVVGANSDVLVGYTGPTNFANGATSLSLTFNDFNSNEAFALWTDLDTTNNTEGKVGNSDFDGSTTKIIFTDGSEVNYIWDLPNNDGRSFYAEGLVGIPPGGSVVPEPSSMLLLGSGLVGMILKRRKVA